MVKKITPQAPNALPKSTMMKSGFQKEVLSSMLNQQKAAAQKAIPTERIAHPAQQPLEPAREKVVVNDPVEEVVSPLAASPMAEHPDYIRFELPSRFLFYPFKSLSIRRITFPDLLKINKATKGKVVSVLLDALQATIDRDIRDLTVPDFYAILFWHRLESYTKTPFMVRYVSKYGNTNEISITNTVIEEIQNKMTIERWLEWKEKGFRQPTVRDMEILDSANLSEEETWAYERAQYLQIVGEPSVEDPYGIKSIIEKMSNIPVETIESIREFSAESVHGIKESIQVKDEKFDADKRENDLKDILKYYEQSGASGTSLPFVIEVLRELKEISEAKGAGIKVEPTAQVVPLAFDIWSFFPEI